MAGNNKTKGNRNYKHLTKEERVEIQECLSHGMDFRSIRLVMDKIGDPSKSAEAVPV